ncbi:MAG TPA: aromatic ring-hydroxylating dioxygenase subunit alpha [Albidovulum sp.]|uniref:aromatic ring-hydroxylating oxygenase subunit alpha n=1 Tax=Albidovulum sp. TaxID=1872424 RepID=UPI002C2A0ABE|nr:aromatic ring-hydroxylating dioxygenase subunit alpha [Albidovulum sp.]
MVHPASPLLDHCPETLPREAYVGTDWYAREMATLWSRQWVCVGRVSDLLPGTMRAVQVGLGSVILVRLADGTLRAWHNSCRHRGAELCAGEKAAGKLVTCPYHAWAYAADDGRLISTAHAHPTKDFRREDHGLKPVALKEWAGFVFLSLAAAPPDLKGDIPLVTLDNWPMESLVTAHRWEKTLDCNWKVFWENYSECLHCPGIHPELCDMVPVYREGVMAANERQDWTPDAPEAPRLKPGAETWSLTGAPVAPAFPGLTEAERQAGYTFVTLWPSAFVVAHADYVRSVRLEPLGPDRTRLIAEWHFAPETLAQPGFDAARVAEFAKIVLTQDGDACEMNQRGIASPAYVRGRLMPEEYEVHHFHEWVLNQMEGER